MNRSENYKSVFIIFCVRCGVFCTTLLLYGFIDKPLFRIRQHGLKIQLSRVKHYVISKHMTTSDHRGDTCIHKIL
jgi:hypothetical protein